MTTALVTGATSGIGLAFARQLALRGHDLVVVARDLARLQSVAAELGSQTGVDIEILVADLAVRDQTQRVADRVADPDRPVELVVNNAGFGLATASIDSALRDEERMIEVMCRAVLVVSHAAARAMRERGHGAIVNVSSVAAFASLGSYSAAKSWCLVYTEGLAHELSGTGVTATALCPGFTRTEFHQRARLNMGKLPGAAWLDADRLVKDCLDDVAAAKVVSVPGPLYKALVLGLGLAPRGVVRTVTGAIGTKRRPPAG